MSRNGINYRSMIIPGSLILVDKPTAGKGCQVPASRVAIERTGLFRGSWFLVGAIIVAIVTACFTFPTSVRSASERKVEKGGHEVVLTEEGLIQHYTNAERRKKGLSPLRTSSALNYVAEAHSRNICKTRVFEHESEAFPKGWRTFTNRLRVAGVNNGGENIAYRSLGEKKHKWAGKVVNGWMKSHPHRRNILSSKYQYIGVGFTKCSNRLGYTVQIFSTRPGRLSRIHVAEKHDRLSRQ